jgi:hypothetical protein
VPSFKNTTKQGPRQRCSSSCTCNTSGLWHSVTDKAK